MDKIKILIIEDENYDIYRIKKTLKPFENLIIIKDVVSNGKDAINLIYQNKNAYDICIMDYQIAGGLMGEELIKKMKELDPLMQIIVVTKMTINLTDYSFANRLMRAGAFWYCTKYPVDIEDYIYQPTDFILSLLNAYEKRRLELEKLESNKKLSKNIQDLLSSKPIIGESEKIKELKNLILKCSQSSAPVLIFGASGVGKELVALHIHYSSSRKFETFMPINCGSIPNELVESELFGYEKGAFTGAVKEKKGLFEQADGGTIFLDEIGDLPLSAQVKLLRFLQEGEIEKIGRSQKIKINARIIAATNKNLQEEISAKKFREDLFYRLSVFPVYVPSMKERKEDIPILFDYFLNSFALENNLPVPKIEDEAMRIFIEYEWRGNVRELRNVANRILFLQKNIITKEIAQKALNFLNYNFLSENKTEEDILSKFANFKEIIPLKDFEMSLRKKYFEYVRSNSSSDAEAAKKLGLAPPNFHRMLKELGLK